MQQLSIADFSRSEHKSLLLELKTPNVSKEQKVQKIFKRLTGAIFQAIVKEGIDYCEFSNGNLSIGDLIIVIQICLLFFRKLDHTQNHQSNKKKESCISKNWKPIQMAGQMKTLVEVSSTKRRDQRSSWWLQKLKTQYFAGKVEQAGLNSKYRKL